MPALVKKIVKNYWGQAVWVAGLIYVFGTSMQRLSNVERVQTESNVMIEEIRKYSISNTVDIATIRESISGLKDRMTVRGQYSTVRIP